MVLAAQALARDAEALSLTVDGAPHKGALYRTYRDGDAGEPVDHDRQCGRRDGAGGR